MEEGRTCGEWHEQGGGAGGELHPAQALGGRWLVGALVRALGRRRHVTQRIVGRKGEERKRLPARGARAELRDRGTWVLRKRAWIGRAVLAWRHVVVTCARVLRGRGVLR